MMALKCGHSDNFVKRERSPDKLIKVEIKTTPREIKDLLRVKWRKKRRAKGAIAKLPIYSTVTQNSEAKIRRRKMAICKIKTVVQRAAKDPCSLSFLPVSMSEKAMIKLVAARVNVSIICNSTYQYFSLNSTTILGCPQNVSIVNYH
jgi:hypothetical protein